MSDEPETKPLGPLDLSNAIGRFGVAYVSAICAQAHIGFTEGRPGEDALAIDGQVEFPRIPIRVQIKTTTQWALVGNTATLRLDVEEKWVAKWIQNEAPTFLVCVLLARPVSQWVDCAPPLTKLNSHAIWARVDNIAADTTYIDLRRDQRFTIETLHQWWKLIGEAYGETAVVA